MVLALGLDSGEEMKPNRRTFFLAMFTLMFASQAEARRGGGRRRVNFSGKGIPQGASHSGTVLSREQLRHCVDEERKINSLSDSVEIDQAMLDSEQAGLKQLERTIEREQFHVNRYSQESVDSFNSLVDQHRKKVAAFNNKLTPLNEKVSSLNSSIDGFNKQCAQRAYYESDMNAVLNRRAK
jgi:hypothetical protein